MTEVRDYVSQFIWMIGYNKLLVFYASYQPNKTCLNFRLILNQPKLDISLPKGQSLDELNLF